jgi:fucose 4-O-acetylase-like acetyltransferase
MAISSLTQSTKPQTSRFDWADYAKGIGIFLVVLGHSLQGLSKSHILPEAAWSDGLERWLYTFHMPLFFFLSGLFIDRAIRKPFKTVVRDRLLLLGYPYLLWSVIQLLMQIAMAGQTNTAANWWDIPKILYEPVQQFWFLYALFIVSTVYVLVRQLRVPWIVCLVVSAGLYGVVVLGWFPRHVWPMLGKSCFFSLFFTLGSGWGARLGGGSPGGRYSFLWALLGYGIVGFVVWQHWEKLFPVKFLVAMAGTFASLALAQGLARIKALDVVRRWGILSLEIFTAHTIASAMLRVLLLKGFHLQLPWVHLVLSVALGIYVPIWIDRLSRKVGFPYLFSLKPRHN